MAELTEKLQHRRLQTFPNAQDAPLRAQLENQSMKFQIEQNRQIPIVRERRTFEPVDHVLQRIEVPGVVAVE
jgi:hypothetical protein